MPLATQCFHSNHVLFVLLPLCCSTRRQPSIHRVCNKSKQVNNLEVRYSLRLTPMDKAGRTLKHLAELTASRAFLLSHEVTAKIPCRQWSAWGKCWASLLESVKIVPGITIQVPWVPGAFHTRFPVSVKSSGGEKKTSGTQGTIQETVLVFILITKRIRRSKKAACLMTWTRAWMQTREFPAVISFKSC